jgi:hypothetical protein
VLASQCPSDDIAEADSAARRWVDGRYRPIILRLLRISVLVGATWFTATLFDAITWFYFLATGRTIAKAIFIIRLILVRCVPHFSPYQMLSPLSLSHLHCVLQHHRADGRHHPGRAVRVPVSRVF